MAEPTERIAILLELQQQAFEKKAKSAGAAIDRLERKFTPLAAAEAKLEKQQLRFNAALEAGTIDAAQHAKGMDLVQREYEQTAERAKRLTTNVVAMNSSVAAQTGFMTRNRAIFQQGGYQVGDFAVQVQGGTSALTAFTQQGSQFLGIFGPWGAVMGAILAVGAPVAGVLWGIMNSASDAGDSAGDLTDKLKALRDSIEAVRAADSLSGVDMSKEFGDMAVQAETIFEINRKIAAIRASSALDTAARGVASELGVAGVFGFTPDEVRELDQTIADISSRMEQLNSPSEMSDTQFAAANRELAELRDRLSDLQDVSSNIDGLGDALGVTADQASEIVAQFAAIGQASGPEEQAEAMATLADYINGATQNLESAGDEGRAFYDQLLEATIQALNLAKIDLSSNIAAGATEAGRLAENLGISLATAQRLAALGPQGATAPRGGRGGDPRENGGRAIDWQTAEAGEFLDNWKPPKVDKGRSSKGRSKREQEPLFSIAENELEKLKLSIEMLGKSKIEVAELTFRHKMLEEAKKRGMAITDELTAKIDAEAANVGRLADQYDQARDKVAAMEKIQGDFKDSVIDAAMGGENAMDSFTKSIKRAAIEYALFGTGMFSGGSKSGGGLLGGLLGGAAGSFAGWFDKGGNIPSGQFGIAGENGAELVRGPASITSTKDTAKMMQGGGAGTVRIVIEEAPGFAATVRTEAQGVAVEVVNQNNKALARRQRTS